MSKIKVQLDKQQVKAYPREFSLLTELTGTYKLKDNYDLDSEAILKLAQKGYVAEDKVKALISDRDKVPFAELAEVLYRSSPAVKGQGNCIGWAAQDSSGQLAPFKFTRRELLPEDVEIQITYAGMCHSDYHQVHNEWKQSKYPMVPGHEIVGIVTAVGDKVKKFKVGNRVAVGTVVNSCGTCRFCKTDLQQICKGCVWTYNSPDPLENNSISMGGYSTHIVVTQGYVLELPESLDMSRAAPLLCAGITVYSPMTYWKLDKKGLKVGVVGLGGLGHMVVKFGIAFGCEVTVISRNKSKEADAKALGAHHYLVSEDKEAMKAAAGTLNGIIDTVSAPHDLGQLVELLDFEGKYIIVGIPPEPLQVPLGLLAFKKAVLTGSPVGGIKETQAMLNFCAKKQVLPDVEIVPAEDVNKAMARMFKADVRFRFVIDIQGSLFTDKPNPASVSGTASPAGPPTPANSTVNAATTATTTAVTAAATAATTAATNAVQAATAAANAAVAAATAHMQPPPPPARPAPTAPVTTPATLAAPPTPATPATAPVVQVGFQAPPPPPRPAPTTPKADAEE